MQLLRTDMRTRREAEGGVGWKMRTDAYTLSRVKEKASGSSVWFSVTTQRGGVGGGRERCKREGMYIYIHNSLCCIAETNTTWKAITIRNNNYKILIQILKISS